MSFLGNIFKGVTNAFSAITSPQSTLLSAGANLVGSFLTNRQNANIAADNNASAIELANTAHQREVKDLDAAGLNPILSATGGSGASTPSMQGATMMNPVSSALQAAQISKDLESADANIAQTKAATKTAATQAELNRRSAKLVDANADNARVNNRLLNMEAIGASNNADFESSAFGKATRYTDRIVKSLTGTLDAASSAKSLATKAKPKVPLVVVHPK